MKIQFIQPRYHTNQHPWVKALKDYGHNVSVLAQYEYIEENHSILEPEIVGYPLIIKKINRILGGDRDKLINYSPPPTKLGEYISDFNPDIIVIRDYSVYSIVSVIFAAYHNTPVLFYDQLPKYGPEYGKKMLVANNVYRAICRGEPVRITPVKGDPEHAPPDPQAHYTPFVREVHKKANNKTYFEGKWIKILSIGKLNVKRKNHLMLLEAIKNLREHYNLKVTLLGHLENPNGENYRNIIEFIHKNDLEEVVDLRYNVKHEQVQQMYLNHDLYILPSSNEPAAVSPLEAMAHGLPVICSDTNGTQWYINPGENGYIFESGNKKDLLEKIERVLDPEQLSLMGEKSVQIVKDNHSSSKFVQEFLKAASEARSNFQPIFDRA